MNPRLAFHEISDRRCSSWKVYPPEQKDQKDDLNRYAARFNMPSEELCIDFDRYRRQWLHQHWARGSQILELTTCSSLAADVSSNTIYENAGLPLDFMRGYVRLRGKAVKGVAETFAVTVWFPSQYARVPGTIDPDPADEGSMKKAESAWEQIERIFGWGPESHIDAKDFVPGCILESFNRRRQKQSSSRGKICFSSAIPTKLTAGDRDDGTPRLKVEIINNHHRNYYEGKGWPGDWENPVPTYFLAVRPGAVFQFPLSKLGPEVTDEDLTLAQQWLVGGLTKLGFGAKTGVGYGRFHGNAERYTVAKREGGKYTLEPCQEERNTHEELKSDSEVDMLSPEELRELQELLPGVTIQQQGLKIVFEADLEFLTPAFIGGANQDAEDWRTYLSNVGQQGNGHDQLLELASKDSQVLGKAFKSGLRMWWRTMHSGYMPYDVLLKLENFVYGSTEMGQRVEVSIQPIQTSTTRFDLRNQREVGVYHAKKRRSVFKKPVRNQVDSEKAKANGLESLDLTANPYTVQGLFYQAYGADEVDYDKDHDFDANNDPIPRQKTYQLHQRHYLDEGSRYRIAISISPPRANDWISVSHAMIVAEVAHSLRLFSCFGARGSRARKGFGCFEVGTLTRSLLINQERAQSIVLNANDSANSFRSEVQASIGENVCQWNDAYWVTASLRRSIGPVVFVLETIDARRSSMHGIDLLGLAVQAFAKEHQHRLYKAGLGLPRKDIHADWDIVREKWIVKLLENDYLVNAWKKIGFAAESGTPFHKQLQNRLHRFASPIHLRVFTTLASDNKDLSASFVAFIDPAIPCVNAQAAYPKTSEQLLRDFGSWLHDSFHLRNDEQPNEIDSTLDSVLDDVKRDEEKAPIHWAKLIPDHNKKKNRPCVETCALIDGQKLKAVLLRPQIQQDEADEWEATKGKLLSLTSSGTAYFVRVYYQGTDGGGQHRLELLPNEKPTNRVPPA
jgi:CRISPR type III-B/RAMP module RAMP protein Cmr6